LNEYSQRRRLTLVDTGSNATMGTMIFLLPAELSPDAAYELERAWLAGSDRVPWPTEAHVEHQHLILQRPASESGHLVAPWSIDGAGRLMGASGTLIERPLPYPYLLELARGKVNQLRCHAQSCQDSGVSLPATVQEQIHRAHQALAHAIAIGSTAEADRAASAALTLGYRSAEQLIHESSNQLLPIRRRDQPRLDTALGCRVSTVLADAAARAFAMTFGRISLAFPWSSIEPNEGRYDWSQQDALLEWAEREGLEVTGGPLLDFSSAQLPDWLWLWERDLTSLGKFMSSYVTAALQRYRGRIRRWQLTSASNSASVLSLSEYEILWLTVKLGRMARQVNEEIELVVNVAQPWCDYMAHEHRDQSPYVFAETLIREWNAAAVDLEVVMGVAPRGSYCRDLLETAFLLDSYAGLGVPVRVTLGYPSGSTVDPKADPEQCVDGGYWHSGVHEAVQADWAASFAALALAKPFVEAVHWVDFSDADLHQFLHCGLVDAAGRPKPSLQTLGQLRKAHLSGR